MDGTGSESCPTAEFCDSILAPLDYTTRNLVNGSIVDFSS